MRVGGEALRGGEREHWHPATDQLAGTDVYGTYDETYTADPATFSIAWDWDDYSQVLLGLSDFSYWLIADEETIFTIGSPMNASIVQSNAAPNGPSYKALWYNRDGHGEDPWASVYDHWDDDPGMVYGGESKTGHLEHLGLTPTASARAYGFGELLFSFSSFSFPLGLSFINLHQERRGGDRGGYISRRSKF